MKFRTLGVALLMGSGLALSAIAASPAVAQPYPPAGCVGPFGTGTVTPVVADVGEEVTFSGCGFEPATIVQIAVDGVPFGTVLAEADTTFSIAITFDAAGEYVLTATGQQAQALLGLASGTEAELSTGGATGVEAVPASAPSLTRVVTATAVVKEDDDHDKPDQPKDDDWWHGGGGGGWGDPGDYPTHGPGDYPTDGPGDYPTGDPGDYRTDGPGGYPTGDPGDYPTETPTAAATVAPVETVTPPHQVRPPQQTGGLPFTGVETGALAAIAVALVGGGVLIRVAARKRRNIGGTNS